MPATMRASLAADRTQVGPASKKSAVRPIPDKRSSARVEQQAEHKAEQKAAEACSALMRGESGVAEARFDELDHLLRSEDAKRQKAESQRLEKAKEIAEVRNLPQEPDSDDD